MDEYTRTLHDAVNAAVAGDRQALYVAQWMLTDLRRRLEPQSSLGTAPPTPARHG